MEQLAKLVLRGEVVTVTMKGLSNSQRLYAGDLVEEMLQEPQLQPTIQNFCMTLGQRTIRGEYQVWENCYQEVRIAFYRIVTYLLYHEKKQCPNCKKKYTTSFSKLEKCPKCENKLVVTWPPQDLKCSSCSMIYSGGDKIKFCIKCKTPLQVSTLNTPTQNRELRNIFKNSENKWVNKRRKVVRKKMFQHYAFNYMKWILDDNKPQKRWELMNITGRSRDIIKLKIESFYSGHKIKYETLIKSPSTVVIHSNLKLISQKNLQEIAKIAKDANDIDVECIFADDSIVVNCDSDKIISAPIKMMTKIKQEKIEYIKNIKTKEEGELYTTLDEISPKLPTTCLKILDLMMNPPEKYSEEFGETYHKKNMAEFLGLESKDVCGALTTIKLHLQAEGITC